MKNILLPALLVSLATAFSDFSNVKWMHGTNGQFLLPLLHRTNYSILSFGQLMRKAKIAPYGGETFENGGVTMLVGISNFFISASEPGNIGYFDPLGYSLCSFSSHTHSNLNETTMHDNLIRSYKWRINRFSKLTGQDSDFSSYGTDLLNSELSQHGAIIHNSQLLKQWDMKWWDEVKDIERPVALRAATREDFLNSLICIFQKQSADIPQIFKECGIQNGNSNDENVYFYDKWKFFDFSDEYFQTPSNVILNFLKYMSFMSRVKTKGYVWQASPETKTNILKDLYALLRLKNDEIKIIDSINQTSANLFLNRFKRVLKEMKKELEEIYEEYENIGESGPFLKLSKKEKRQMLEGPFPIIIGSTVRKPDFEYSGSHDYLVSPVKSDEWDLIMTNEKNLDRLNKWIHDNNLTDKKVATLEELVKWRSEVMRYTSATAKCGEKHVYLQDHLNIDLPKINQNHGFRYNSDFGFVFSHLLSK